MVTVAVQVTAAVLLASAGLLKLRNPGSVSATAASLGLPRVVTQGKVGRVLPAVLIGTELALAAALVSPVARIAAGLTAALLVSFGLLLTLAFVRGEAVRCGCFGTAGATATVWSPIRNLVLAAGCAGIAAGWLSNPGPARHLWSWSPVQLAVTGTAVAVALALAVDNRQLRQAPLPPDSSGIDLELDRLVLATVGGQPVRWSDVLGRSPVVLVFVDPHCAPCERLLTQMAGWLRRDDLSLLLVSRGGVTENAALAAQVGAEVLVQQDFELAALLGVRGTPAAVVLDNGGHATAGPVHGVEGVVRLAMRLELDNHQSLPSTKAALPESTVVREHS